MRAPRPVLHYEQQGLGPTTRPNEMIREGGARGGVRLRALQLLPQVAQRLAVPLSRDRTEAELPLGERQRP